MNTQMPVSMDDIAPTLPAAPVSPTSSQGSWVVQIEDGGWDGLGRSPPLSPHRQMQGFQLTPQHQQEHSPRKGPISPSGSWAGVVVAVGVGAPSSSVLAVEYPRSPSPPGSPGMVKSEGLADLARDEVQVSIDGLAAALDDAVMRGLEKVDGADHHRRTSVEVQLAPEAQDDSTECSAVAAVRERKRPGESKVDDGAAVEYGAISDGPVNVQDATSSAAAEGIVHVAAPEQASLAVAGSGSGTASIAVVNTSATPTVVPKGTGITPAARTAAKTLPRTGTPPITASPRRSVSGSSIVGPQVRYCTALLYIWTR